MGSTSILEPRGTRPRSKCASSRTGFLPLAAASDRLDWMQAIQPIMKTLFIALVALTVGTAYGQYVLEGINAGTQLIQEQRQQS